MTASISNKNEAFSDVDEKYFSTEHYLSTTKGENSLNQKSNINVTSSSDKLSSVESVTWTTSKPNSLSSTTSSKNITELTYEENNAVLKIVLRRERKIDTQVTASERLLATDILINHGMYYDTRQLPIIRHPYGNNDVRCKPVNQSNCEPDRIIFKAHGPQTGMCVASDR